MGAQGTTAFHPDGQRGSPVPARRRRAGGIIPITTPAQIRSGMSGKLAQRVLDSGLAPALKPVAVAMALFGNVDGTSIYPSVERVAWGLGVTPRTVQRNLKQLRAPRRSASRERSQGRRRAKRPLQA